MKTHRPAPERRPPPRGFTLIELLVVMAIIAILAALTMGTFQMSQQSSARNRTTAALQSIMSDLEKYKDKFGEYPEPANPAMMGSGGASGFRIGGALMLYQAITGDGNDHIKLASGASGQNSDGKVDDTERPNSINATLPKPMVLNTANGYMLVDGFGHPFQYEKGGGTDAVNGSYDVWSFAQLDSTKDSAKVRYDASSKRNPALTAVWIKNW